MRKHLIYNLMTAIGCIIMGIAVNAFYIPHQLLSGGIGGIAVMLYYLFGLPMGIVTILINIPLFLLAYRYMDHSYPLKAVFGMLAYSFSLDFFSFLIPLAPIKDTLFSCIVGGTLNGIGAAFLYRVGSSSGGTDIIGAIFNKHYSIGISTPGFIINIILMAIAGLLFGLEPALYTLLASFISFKVANTFTDGFDYKKNIIIISNQSPVIAQEIIKIVGRGVTFLHGEGAFTHQPREILLVVAKLTQLAQIKGIVSKIDPHAFMIIHDVTDVMGKGFTNIPAVKKKHDTE
ncbi:MAG: YitT family protein [Acidaminococcaceae bacterium]